MGYAGGGFLLSLCLGCSSAGGKANGSQEPMTPEVDGQAPSQVTSPGDVPQPSATKQDARSALPADDVAVADAPPPAEAIPCVGSPYAVCADFETGKLPVGWTLAISPGETANVEATKVAHGKFALHLGALSKGKSVKLVTSALGGITNVMWGRFYLYMSPGAPVGHTALFNAFDQDRNWWAVGAEFNSYFANWHPPSCCPEKFMRSKVVIPGDKWACYEFQFDGAQPSVAKVWADGQPVTFYNVSNRAGPNVVQKFTKVELGLMPYHSLSLKSYDGDDPPLLTDVYMDDFALDTKRIGCLP